MDPTGLILARAFARLEAAGIGCPVYGAPPKDATLPYAELAVAKDEGGWALELHAWSGYRGDAEALAILAAAYPHLHDRRIVSEQGVAVWARQAESRVLVQEDGAVRHGLAIYRLLVNQRR